MYTLDANGKRVYTLKKVAEGRITNSAHPARFSPDDTYSRYALQDASDLLLSLSLCMPATKQILCWLSRKLCASKSSWQGRGDQRHEADRDAGTV